MKFLIHYVFPNGVVRRFSIEEEDEGIARTIQGAASKTGDHSQHAAWLRYYLELRMDEQLSDADMVGIDYGDYDKVIFSAWSDE